MIKGRKCPEMIKNCPICEKDFNAKGAAKYCSPDCQTAGYAKRRKDWEASSGYKEKQKQAKRQSREQQRTTITAEIQERREQQQAEMEQWKIERQKKNDAELKERADNGEPLALAELAKRSGDMREHWRLQKVAMIENLRQFGRVLQPGQHRVNGIDMTDPNFEDLVVGVMEAEGSRQHEKDG